VFHAARHKKQGTWDIENTVTWSPNFEFSSLSFYTYENDENNNNCTFSHSHTYR